VLILCVGKSTAPDLSHAQANLSAASKSAGAYFSSWGSWASEKRKGWGGKTPVSSPPPSAGPLPLDMKRAEDFSREKDRTVGGAEVKGEGETQGVFFDAERDRMGAGGKV
jgi:hypothetical protein